jgi:hypothetical protein
MLPERAPGPPVATRRQTPESPGPTMTTAVAHLLGQKEDLARNVVTRSSLPGGARLHLREFRGGAPGAWPGDQRQKAQAADVLKGCAAVRDPGCTRTQE